MADAVEKIEESAEEAPETSGVSADLAKDIDSSVEDAMTEIEKDKAPVEDPDAGDKKIVPSEEDPSGDEAAPGGEEEDGDKSEEGGDDDPDPVTDELLERAVKAGLKIADARKCPSASMLTDICTQLETAKKPDGDDAGGDEENVDEDPLASIPDLDPNEYDDDVVAAVAGLKKIASKLIDENKELKAAGQNNDSKTWFDSKVSGLDDKVTKALKKAPEKLTELQDHFDVLAAGYKATGKDVKRDDIFKAAAATVLGDVITQASDDEKADRLRDRSGQFVSRPAGASVKPVIDAFDDAASDIDKKYFGK